MNRLRTINESLQEQGPIKGVYGGFSVSASYDEDDKKIKTKIDFNVNSWNAQINESVDRASVDKLELMKRDINMVMQDMDKKLRQIIDKYGFNK